MLSLTLPAVLKEGRCCPPRALLEPCPSQTSSPELSSSPQHQQPQSECHNSRQGAEDEPDWPRRWKHQAWVQAVPAARDLLCLACALAAGKGTSMGILQACAGIWKGSTDPETCTMSCCRVGTGPGALPLQPQQRQSCCREHLSEPCSSVRALASREPGKKK